MNVRVAMTPVLRAPARHPRHRLKALLAALVATACLMVAAGVPTGEAQAATTAATPVTNPLNSSGPDSYMTYYQGYYYLMTTPWNGPLTMRKAPTIAALAQAAPVPVFSDFPADRCCQVWAPELHLLDGRDRSAADGAPVVQWQCNGGTHQQFRREPYDGHFRLVARHSGKCLAVAGASTADAAPLEQRTCSADAAFQWQRG
ncbi:RICIN domain-containing protein [Streptomyces sp. NPDC086838]|uniref:RICIN domain-containing protein n=1 Tax=Streptomyces sp. NPDC086838 TaxID=3365762 RepID=UPI0038075BD2